MEPPVSFEADALRDEKTKLLRSVHLHLLRFHDGLQIHYQHSALRQGKSALLAYHHLQF